MRKTAVVYADSLLIVNFSMDFLALYITARMLGAPVRALRLTVGALLGAVFALAEALVDVSAAGGVVKLFSLVASIACAFAMARIAFSSRSYAWMSAALAYFAVSIGLGGIMTAIYSFVVRSAKALNIRPPDTSPDASPIMFCIAALISGVVSLMYGKFRKKTSTKRVVKVRVDLLGRTAEFDGLCDSGNLLREPFGGKPVIVVAIEKIREVLPEEILHAAMSQDLTKSASPGLQKRMRFIPTSSVTGAGLLVGFLPDRIKIDGREIDAVAAIDTHSQNYVGCGAVVPQILLNL